MYLCLFANDAKYAAKAKLGFDVFKMLIKLFVYVIGTAIGRALINNHNIIEESFYEIKKWLFITWI